MEIHVYNGDFNLPSIDFDCLRVLLYIKLKNIPVTIKQTNNPHKSPNGLLPFLSDGDLKKTGYSDIVKYFIQKGFNLQENLTDRERILSDGHILNLFQHLSPSFLYTLWGQALNLNETRTIYGKLIPFPFNFYYPKKYIYKTQLLLEVLSDINIDEQVNENDVDEIMNDAKKCLNFLSYRLKKQLWFIAADPTEFDIAVFSYLSILYKFKLPKNPLESHIKECPNLVNFIDRITKKYFSDAIFSTYKSIEFKKDGESLSTSSCTMTGDTDDDNSRKIQILAGASAILAMVGYAIGSGLLSISRYNENLDDSQLIEYYDDSDDYENH